MQHIATGIKYDPSEKNDQWISYLNFDGEEGYPGIEESIVVLTNAGVFDAVIDDIDPANGSYLIGYVAGPLLETY